MTTPASRLVRNERLWVPLLTHFDEKGNVDRKRTAAHVRAVRPSLSGFLLAGSTGAGWAMSDAQFDQVLDIAFESDVFDADSLLLLGCLRPTTEEVIARARKVEARAGGRSPAAHYVGLTICPPVGATTQDQVLDHFEQVMAATQSPIAIYQLPQVTRCEVAPDTMRKLLERGRIHMFKDTSGEDRVANAGVLGDAIWTLRGAEGGYYEAVAAPGAYDGWLLSTANGLARHYRAILEALDRGDDATARIISDRVTRAVTQIFKLAAELPSGNAFSNANRAIDHVQAYGPRYLTAPMPRRVDGSPLPAEFLRQVNEIMQANELSAQSAYLSS